MYEDLSKSGGKPIDNARCARVPETKNNHLNWSAFRGRGNLAKIEVEGQHVSTFKNCFLEDFAVWKSVKSLISQMDGVMTIPAQPSHHANIALISAKNRMECPQDTRTSS
ncbi:MAG TPA: hypothetical protein PLT20_03035 [Sedimentisphaerales bacterium]|nr:hypothetical protein [Sedimentisphaerales bacterium]